MHRSAPHLRPENRRQLAPLETPYEVGGEFPSPTPAVESSERNQSHPSLPAQARLLAPTPLSALVTPAASVSMLPRQASPPRLRPPSRPLVCPCEHWQRVTWVVDARPEVKTTLGPGKRLRGAVPAAVRWAKERVRRSWCRSPMPHLMRGLVSGVGSGGGVVQGVTRPLYRFRPQGLSGRQLN